MKKLFLLPAALLLVLLATAQNYETIRNTMILGQLKKAKEDLDKGMTNAKFASKAEAYLLKTAIYGGLAMDEAIKLTPEAEQLRNEAAAAFAKYREMEPALTLMKEPAYQNAPVNLYSSYFTAGYKDYETKKWEHGYQMFVKAIDLSDLMIREKLFAVSLDTNSLILGGIMAENAKHKDDAAKYYTRLADAKVSGADFESVYRFLVNYYFTKKDMAAFEKYKATGKELYPKSDFFNYDKIDFAVGLEDSFDAKIKALEEALASDPDNPKANEYLGELIYDVLNPKEEGTALPPNADDLEKKMVVAFNKSGAADPNGETPYIFIGNHFISKSVKIGDAKDAHATAMKAKAKPNVKPAAEDVQKRDLLNKQYGDALEGAREAYENAAKIFGERMKKKPLDLKEKNQYKKIVGYLSDIYAYKKDQAKGKPADVAKFAAEEKKWNDLYETIK